MYLYNGSMQLDNFLIFAQLMSVFTLIFLLIELLTWYLKGFFLYLMAQLVLGLLIGKLGSNGVHLLPREQSFTVFQEPLTSPLIVEPNITQIGTSRY